MSFVSAAPRTLIVHDERPKTRADYGELPTREIFRLIDKQQVIQDDPPTDEEYLEATFALQELYGALAARRRV